jgi:carbamoyltransferase
MIVLGLHGYFGSEHDAGAALIVDGIARAAVEEERLLRKKRAIGAEPCLSAQEVLAISGIEAYDIDVIAHPGLPELINSSSIIEANKIRSSLMKAGLRIKPNIPVEFVPHHLAHAWTGLMYVPKNERHDVDIVALDGCGESTAGAFFKLHNGIVEAQWYLDIRDSPGAFFEAATTVCGFNWGQEGKTMGLASYGECDKQLNILKHQRLFSNMPRRSVDYLTLIRDYSRKIKRELGIPRTFMQKARIAYLAQKNLEEWTWEILSKIDSKVIVFVGGTALNCAMNGILANRLKKRGQKLYIPPPASDTGIALGAACAVDNSSISHSIKSAGLGRQYQIEEIETVAKNEGYGLSACSLSDIAEFVRSGLVLGWFHDRAEIGPRALGARCIIARSDSEYMRDKINVMKGRESWRPLAPSVTPEEFARSFDGVPSPYMLKANRVLFGTNGFEGVTHVDGTVRPQIVYDSSPYFDLLKAVGRAGMRESIICTSFNRAGEPIVYRPEDAFRSAGLLGIDRLVGDGWTVKLRKSER